MKALSRRIVLPGLIGAVLALSACTPGAEEAAPKITLKSAWMRLPPGGRDRSAAYLVIQNDGGADVLRVVSSPLAKDVQMHIHEMDGEIMRMRREEEIVIPAHKSVHYQPGGRHLMMLGIQQELKFGDKVPLTLTFERAGAISVIAIVGNGP